nr:pentapeptide repeat-containing protein [Campylobacter coli]
MENFDKKLAQYGILAKNGEIFLEDNKITILDAEIKEINFQTLQEAGIKEICIFGSEIKYLYFLEKNTIKIDFKVCNFKNQIIAKKAYFENEVIFQQCVFDAIVDFSKVEFNSKIDFLASVFKGEVRFIGTQFQAEQSNNEIIENNFREVIFEGRASFSNATFKARVSFALSQFKSEANFIKTEFQANQNDSDIIENQFLEVVFIGKIIFDHATFQARVSFRNSQFKDEVRFIKAQFLAEQNNSKIIENDFREVVFKGKVAFDSIILKARISFSFSTFKDETFFLNINPNNCIFHNVEFNKINFIHKDDINVVSNAESYVFHNAVFKDTLSFEGMEFERLGFDNVLFNGVVTFSNTKLNTKPQFINCTFSNQFNIEHQYIKYSDKDIENKINNIQDKNDKFRALLNLRDLFRKLKSNRIAHHNLIDASELRTQELYARELELKYKEKKSLRETIEQWQLFFYRKLCDHHTDLLLNLRWLVVLIGSFALLYFTSRVIQDINLLKVLNQYGVCLSIVGVFNLLCLYWFGYIKKFDFFVYFNLIAVLWVVCYKPKIIFGIVNLIDSNSYNGFENALITIYTILLALVLFSLQKTARKNSIVPS